MSPRWCVCGGFETVSCALSVDVLFHWEEVHKPTSTGDLINRVMPASGRSVYDPRQNFDPESLRRPGKEMWVLHPLGEAPPLDVPPESVQVVLLDGNWRQSGDMMRAMEGKGRRIQLPMTGESRYLLRKQAGEGKFCTIEALIFLLSTLGLTPEAAALQRQFELHVYAGLLSRGKVVEAANYLLHSPITKAFPEVVSRLQARPRQRPLS